MASDLPQPPPEAQDIFSLSDQVLADTLQFVTEIGFGNWGSVWLCRPKCNPASPSADGLTRVQGMEVAVKVVHRSKTKTTAARVRSLWNEMKIVRSFKNDPHPSIIPFHSFIITPSYALITMAYLPTLIPVEVDESKTKPWFRSLLSGIEFLHKRGVVHNDIKPANILLSEERVPVLVDFGFAEKYDLKSGKAFHSNLMYGTPEYLSPERARGLPHDTRKSDLWSLGVTFFEILMGRTPFEYAETEEFASKEDMERYWGRTLRGKWVGSWKMSKGMEKLLRRMITPNADLRCNAADAMADPYWSGRVEPASHKRSVSASHTPSQSINLDKEMSKLMDVSLPWSPRSTSKNKNKENIIPPPEDKGPKSIFNSGTHSRSKSQPKVTAHKPALQPKNRPAVLPLANLLPIKASPPISPKSPLAARGQCENSDTNANFISFSSINNVTTPARKPVGGGVRQPLLALPQNVSPAPIITSKAKSRDAGNNRTSVFKDLTGLNNRSVGRPAMIVREKPKPLPKGKNKENGADVSGKEQDSVRKRVQEWERERERLREMNRLELFEKERDEELRRASRDEDLGDVSLVTTSSAASSTEKDEGIQFAKVAVRASAQIVPTTPSFLDLSATPSDSNSRSAKESGLSALKQSLKVSIDKGVRIYKASTLGQVTGRTTPAHSLTVEGIEEPEWNVDVSERQPWEDDGIVRDAKSSLPGVRRAVRNERVAEDTMSLWMRNVDKVVEDARQKFDSAAVGVPQLPLPIPPSISRSVSQSRTSSRLPRKVLAANQIFSDQSASSMSTSVNVDAPGRVDKTLPPIPSEDANRVTDFLAASTPPRPRRATITTRSPAALKEQASFDVDTGSPSKRKEKSKSQGNLLRPIATIDRLELELQKDAMPPKSPRLSAFLDKSLFVAPPMGRTEDESSANSDSTFLRSRSLDIDHLTSSLVHVESYPPRKSSGAPPVVLDTPNRRRIEGVYDRFLLATAGVKRVGRGYQSDDLGPAQNAPDPGPSTHFHKHNNNHRIFNTTRPMPPPVSSEDLKLPRTVDESGLVSPKASADVSHYKDDGNNTVALVRRAFKAVTGKTVTRRLSRAILT